MNFKNLVSPGMSYQDIILRILDILEGMSQSIEELNLKVNAMSKTIEGFIENDKN